ncbi:MAG: SDR family NAD(P)-dependent oxidoreductase [Candidatus Peribacteraceae bacterium]|jgi:NAD(P)-dependent dehydrogenase (short-subunit alcohol dehydrogenase family)
MEEKKRVVVITGSSSGIGFAIAKRFLSKNHRVVLNGRHNAEDNTELQTLIDGNLDALYVKADVSQYEQAKMLIDTTINHFGRLDVLVNNAGIIKDRFFHKMEENEWDEVIRTNLYGIINCCYASVSFMRTQESGSIINMSSVSAVIGNLGQTSYSAAKAGILGFTRSLAMECAAKNVRVNAICPGLIDTRILETIPDAAMQDFLQKIPMKRLGLPEEVADLAFFLASDRAKYITGQTIHINGGLYM